MTTNTSRTLCWRQTHRRRGSNPSARSRCWGNQRCLSNCCRLHSNEWVPTTDQMRVATFLQQCRRGEITMNIASTSTNLSKNWLRPQILADSAIFDRYCSEWCRQVDLLEPCETIALPIDFFFFFRLKKKKTLIQQSKHIRHWWQLQRACQLCSALYNFKKIVKWNLDCNETNCTKWICWSCEHRSLVRRTQLVTSPFNNVLLKKLTKNNDSHGAFAVAGSFIIFLKNENKNDQVWSKL